MSFEVTDRALAPYYVDLDMDYTEMDKIRQNAFEDYVSFDGEYSGKYIDQYEILLSMIKDKIIEEGFFDPEEDEWEI